MSKQVLLPVLMLAAAMLNGSTLSAQDKAKKADQIDTVYPIAVFPFQERGEDAKGLGSQASDLMFANLVSEPELYLVERADLKKLIEEQELGASGLVKPGQAAEIGQLTGAKILVTGSVLQVGEKLYVVGKVIGTETSRVLGASVKGNIEDDLDELVEALSKKVSETIFERAEDLVAEPTPRVDRIAAIKKKLGKAKLPRVKITVSERHVGNSTLDPAAETELVAICKELGFDVIDSSGKSSDADILLSGEGFSQFASRHGNLVSVKARVELKALNPESGQVIAVDRQTSVAVDLAEQIAGKAALQDAATSLAARLLPKLVDSKSNPRKKSKDKAKQN